MKKLIAIILINVLIIIGCSKKNNPSSPEYPNNQEFAEPVLSDYLYLNIGNSWTYFTSKVNSLGEIDPSSIGTTVMSVLQKNVLIGGQPNAFIMQVASNGGQPGNMAFFITNKTLYNYFGDNSLTPILPAPIYWSPSTISSVSVGVNQSKVYTIIDLSNNALSFTIKRPPNSAIALATMSSSAVLQVTGVSPGNTTLALQKIGGTAMDTMTVLIAVGGSPQSIGIPPWLPIWQLTTSTSEDTMYSWDTTYSFKRYQNHSLCTDKITYLITNRFLNTENVMVAQEIVSCDKFEMKITVKEKIDTNSINVFNGYSTENTLTMWLAKGWGFVKGINNGNSRSLAIIYNGTTDSYGVLDGYYISPRVNYISIEPLQMDYLTINIEPLTTNLSSVSYLLTSKNFHK